MSRMELGLAIGADRVAARWIDSSGADRRWNADLGETRPLDHALGELADVIGTASRVSVTVAVLPPLARARHVTLPPMSARDRALAVGRMPARYFLGLAEPVAVVAAPRGQIVFAVSEQTLRTIDAAMAAAGWQLDRVVPAYAAWRMAALKRWPAARRGSHDVVAAGDAEWTTITLADGEPQMIRRTRDPRSATGSLLLADDAAAAAGEAAAFARSVTDVELVSADEAIRRSRSAGRAARWLTAAAALLLLAAGGVRHIGLLRERDAIIAQRAAMRTRVGAAMSERDSLSRVASVIVAVSRLEQTAPRWSAVVARAAAALPARSSFVSLRAEGDSARIEGEADDATAVFTRLQRAPGLLSVRPVGSIRQETGSDSRTIERWTVSAKVDHRRAVRGDR